MLDLSLIDPAFLTRRVTRPNPLDQWDKETQDNIRKDFDALKKKLFEMHNNPECQELDNDYASATYAKIQQQEQAGRAVLKYCADPFTFIYGVFLLGKSRFAQFSFGHEVLHGSYRSHPDPRFNGKQWTNTLFINEAHWKKGHNQGHHKSPGVFGLDPEASPFPYRGSTDFYAERGDRIAALFTPLVLNFMSLFFIGIVEAKREALFNKKAWKELLATNLRLAKKEFWDYPLQGWFMAPRILLGNMLSFLVAEVISGFLGRTTHIRQDTICLHANEFEQDNKAHYYITCLLNAGNISVDKSDAYWGWAKHIEHHLFPFLSSRMLAEATPEIKALCKKYDLPYHEGTLFQVAKKGYVVDFYNIFSP